MTRDEAISAIRLYLGFYEKKQSEIETQLTLSQGRLERGLKLPQGQGIFMPWFLTSEIQSAVTQLNEDRIPLPQAISLQHTGFLSEVEDAALWILDPEADSEDPWIELIKKPFDEIQRKYPGTGMPSHYDLLGTYFRVRPTPDQEYTLKIVTANGDLLVTTGGGTNKWLTYAPEVLYGHAGMQLAIGLRDATAVSQFTNIFNEGVLALWSNTEARLHINQRYVMGGDD